MRTPRDRRDSVRNGTRLSDSNMSRCTHCCNHPLATPVRTCQLPGLVEVTAVLTEHLRTNLNNACKAYFPTDQLGGKHDVGVRRRHLNCCLCKTLLVQPDTIDRDQLSSSSIPSTYFLPYFSLNMNLRTNLLPRSIRQQHHKAQRNGPPLPLHLPPSPPPPNPLTIDVRLPNPHTRHEGFCKVPLLPCFQLI